MVEVFPYHWVDVSPYESNKVEIHAWCHTRSSESVLVRVENVPYVYYLQLPHLNRQKRKISWTANRAGELIDDILEKLGENFDKEDILETLFCQRGTLHNFKLNNSFPMIKMFFTSKSSGKKFARKLNYDFQIFTGDYLRIKIHEMDLVSTDTKMRAGLGITNCQGIRFSAEPVSEQEKISTSTEYIIDFREIKGIPLEETTDYIFRPKIAAVDWEMYSSNPKKMPNADLEEDAVFQGSFIVKRFREKVETTKRYCIVYGNVNDIPPEKLENCEIIRVDKEEKIFIEFGRLLQIENPDVVIGFNTYGFDFPYLNKRWQNFWPNIETPCFGRIKNEETIFQTKNWESNAHGQVSFDQFSMSGRLCIDILTVLRKEPSYHLENYRLNYIANKFLGDSKNDMSPQEMFRIFKEWKELEKQEVQDEFQEKIAKNREDMTEVALYCIQDSELLIRIAEYINLFVNIIELSNIVRINPIDTINSGQTKRAVSQIFYFCHHKKIVIDKRDIEVKGFSGGYCAEPNKGIHDNVVGLDCASMYPNIMRGWSICYTNLIDPKDLPEIREALGEEFDKKVVKVEFDQEEEDENDEYEEIDGKRKKKKKNTEIKHYVYYWYQSTGVLPNIVGGLIDNRNVVRKGMKSLESRLEQLLDMDKQCFDLFQKERDIHEEDLFQKLDKETLNRTSEINLLRIKLMVMEAKQLALKISANSIYGFIGASFGIPLPEGSRCVTAIGRQTIGRITSYVEKYYDGEHIYGDTDSTMMKCPHVTDKKDLCRFGNQLAYEINNGVRAGEKDALGRIVEESREALLVLPMKIEFEKAMRGIFLKKKKYGYLLYNSDGTIKQEHIKEKGKIVGQKNLICSRGVVSARRDNFKMLREIYDELFIGILDFKSLREIIEILYQKIEYLISGNVPLSDLTIVKSCREEYKLESNPMNIFKNNLIEAGEIVITGDRLEYVIIRDENEPKIGKRMRSIKQYRDSLLTENPMKIDYSYYIHLLEKSVTQLIATSFSREIDTLKNLGDYSVFFRKSTRNPRIHLDKIVKIFEQLYEKFENITFFKTWINEVFSKYQEFVSTLDE